MKPNEFTAGVAVEDITPPLEVGLLISSVEGRWTRFQSVRLPLKARILVIGPPHDRLAIVSLDLLGLSATVVGCWADFKARLSSLLPADRILITCTHTHNAPETLGLSDLYESEAFSTWIATVQKRIRRGIDVAFMSAQSCSVRIADFEVGDYSLQRRISTADGMVISDSLQPISKDLMELGPVDRRIHVVQFKSLQGNVISTMVHAVCHPVHEMCLPQVSSDYPGELCASLDASRACGISLFLNGAAGDINPTTVSCGHETAAAHGKAIAAVVKGSVAHAERIEPLPFAFRTEEIMLEPRKFEGAPDVKNCIARVAVLRLGSFSFVFLPGEPFVAIALEIEKASPFGKTIVVGYSENSVGYIPTIAAFDEGGYETGPGKWSFVQPNAEILIRRTISTMLSDLYSLKLEGDGS
ncbi:hypothetical protein ACFSJU_19230 [Paradesertivirga mongoliensis]|uniref:Neutral/alkaline non-lysosomal ceramidase N-terminal domain-containing protein n=1 Tax=Paradesertivirga mongoliensis TaxID=2100740 RepID=A0ABW4ZSE2_9SPHI|nr:hypothetical protein [Pedobacter mongoliensis]